MPELAEVEYYRTRWNPGLKQRVLAVEAPKNRVYRGADAAVVGRVLKGVTLLESKTHGKQMLFRFTGNAWLGVHLGMTGELEARAADAPTRKHDRLILRQKKQALAFRDARQFGRIRFDISVGEPEWWKKLPPQVMSREFTKKRVAEFLRRRKGAPIKAVLLMQEGFPGIGNWMADEILWQAGIHPRRRAGTLSAHEAAAIHTVTRSVTRTSLRTIGVDWGEPPKKWLIHRRWKRGGHCPRDDAGLKHATIGGRTTCWCPRCQK